MESIPQPTVRNCAGAVAVIAMGYIIYKKSSTKLRQPKKAVVVEDRNEEGSPVVFQRLMNPDDANPAGNVHGGTILKMIEDAGHISATRHCNSGDDGIQSLALTAGAQHCTFQRPMHVGDVCKIQASVTYVGESSMEVTARVWREEGFSGHAEITNEAKLWYVRAKYDPKGFGNGDRSWLLKNIPQVNVPDYPDSNGLGGQARAAEIKPSIADTRKKLEEIDWVSLVPVLQQMMLPSDAEKGGSVFGGVIMKLMDSAAGIAAVRHCATNVVTVSLEALHLVEMVQVGDLVQVYSRIVYTSARSMEIEVLVSAERTFSRRTSATNMPQYGPKRFAAARGLFTFVSLSSEGKTKEIPPLTKEHKDYDAARFAEGKARYELRKKKRAEAVKRTSSQKNKE
eukprot:m.77720 g.77720  ORF g.77720 m.77720 type:complete len:397 (-) comp12638_c0_seq5:125-1315(-)